MSRIEPPQFLSDLYRDLRDRRMLLPIVALLIAIVAVPTVLATSPTSTAPPAPVTAAAGPAAPAVLAKQAGLRNYRERLEALKSTNPFTQKFGTPPAQAVGIDGGTEAVQSIAGGEDSTTPAFGDASTLVDPPAGSDAVSPTSSPSSETTEAPIAGGDLAAEPAVRFYSSRVDVTLGLVGETTTIEGVSALDMLPSPKRPQVLFLGISESGESAIFLISPELTVGEGEGSCSPKPPATCQFLTLEEGESRYLDDTVNQQRYRFGLNAIDLVRIPEPSGLDPEDSSEATGRAILRSGL